MVDVTPSTWSTVTVLADPVRRALYEHVRRQDHPVTREEAAEAVTISRNLTAFHLDKLVDAGLLRARYESPPDRPRGPGRTPKVYEPAGDGVSLSLPPRQYALVGEILTDAIATDPTNARAAVRREAAAAGRRIGASLAGTDPATALRGLDFEPRITDGGDVVLDNCPFHALAERQRDLICGVNLAFVDGLLEGLGVAGLRAELQPRPGGCCVRLTFVH